MQMDGLPHLANIAREDKTVLQHINDGLSNDSYAGTSRTVIMKTRPSNESICCIGIHVSNRDFSGAKH